MRIGVVIVVVIGVRGRRQAGPYLMFHVEQPLGLSRMFHVEHLGATGQGISIYLPVGIYGSRPNFVLRLPQSRAVSPFTSFIPCLSTMDTIWTYDHKPANLSLLNVQLSTMSQTLSSYMWTSVQFTARDRRDMVGQQGGGTKVSKTASVPVLSKKIFDLSLVSRSNVRYSDPKLPDLTSFFPEISPQISQIGPLPLGLQSCFSYHEAHEET